MSNQKKVSYIIKGTGPISLFIGSESLTIAQDHPNYPKILEALKKGEYDKIENLVNVAKAVTNYGKGKITVNNGQVFYNGQGVHNTLTERILKMMAEGFKVDHMLLFLDNLMSNPSFRAVNETYTFLENHGLPITDDGCFLGYKAVRNNYTDMRTGTFNNSVGQTVKMNRNQVNENYHEDCSYGLHVGSLGYVESFGGFSRGQTPASGGNRLLIVKVNPRDVVSVPEYAGHTKMRVCEYVVVDEIKNIVAELDKASVYRANATPAVPDREQDEDAGDWECGCDDCTGKTTESTDSKVDTTSPWNEAAYREGFAVGSSDYDNNEEYGYSRDYSRENSYRIGYNDAFNARPNQADALNEQVSGGAPDTDVEDEEFSRGYTLGSDDAVQGYSFQYSLSLDESDSFKDGYRAGYNDSI